VFVGASRPAAGEVLCRTSVSVFPEILKLAVAVTALPPTVALSEKITVAWAAH